MSLVDWSCSDTAEWLKQHGYAKYASLLCEKHKIDGKALMLLTEEDLKDPPLQITVLGDVKRLAFDIRKIQAENRHVLASLGLLEHNHHAALHLPVSGIHGTSPTLSLHCPRRRTALHDSHCCLDSSDSQASDLPSGDAPHAANVRNGRRTDGMPQTLKPEIWKTLISMIYVFAVTWITAFVMAIVHDRVPDMKKYPPLPDIFLDNVPHISWAFDLCEVTGSLLFLIWVTVLVFHKHRFILMRRFFALSGTVFLLRCVTMLITSLSVPGTHLQCNPQSYGDIWAKLEKAYVIWRGAGLSIQGVRTCGDYMFSGHTVALTMLNFFITEYTPRHLYFIHTFTWMLNMFGVFFILAAHEHYSIDVFIAFYLTSRLFLYYHTLANNRALMQRDSKRTRIWFPLFSFFESQVDGIVPNEFELPFSCWKVKNWVYGRVVKESKKPWKKVKVK